MDIQVTGLVINGLLVAAVVLALSYSHLLLGEASTFSGEKAQPYETGLRPLDPGASGRMSASYYRFALLFVVFDVDLAFLLPWTLLRDSLNPTAMLSMSVFLALVALTLAYVWRKGALSCR